MRQRKGKFLAIDTDVDVLTILTLQFDGAGFDVFTVTGGEKGLELAGHIRPAVIVLDLQLPDIDGLDVCRHLRSISETQTIPVIVLTARASEADRVLALEAGADDFVSKPFSTRELAARVDAVLRRSACSSAAPTVISYGDLTLDLLHHSVMLRGRKLAFTAREFRVLQLLARRSGRLVARRDLSAAAHGCDDVTTHRGLDVCITSIRHKLGCGSDAIRAVHRFGYKLLIPNLQPKDHSIDN